MIVSFQSFPFDYERQFVSEIQKASPPDEAGELDMRTENPGLMWESTKETRRVEQDPGSCRHAACVLLGLKHRGHLLMIEVPLPFCQGDPQAPEEPRTACTQDKHSPPEPTQHGFEGFKAAV